MGGRSDDLPIAAPQTVDIETGPEKVCLKHQNGIDQIGSVRRVFSSLLDSSNDYDPGAGISSHAKSDRFYICSTFFGSYRDVGLSLTRGYDAVSGRWLSRDPIGSTPLYNYADNNPLSLVDPLGLQAISDDRMRHILNSHGALTPRTRPGNSVFSPECSTPEARRQLSRDVFQSPLGPPVPRFTGVCEIEGQVLLRDNDTGKTIPYPIGIDGNQNATNRVRIRYDQTSGDVQTMFPVPMGP